MTAENELRIIEKVKNGDADAFGELVERHQRLVYNLALRMLGSAEDAEDAAQEAFLKAYRSIASFRGESKLSVWLYKLMTNVCLDLLRRRRENTVSLYEEDGEGGERQLEIPDERSDPAREYEKRETREAVQRGLDALSGEHRAAFVLREVSGLSYEEISRALGVDVGTVKSRIFRARKKLCEFLTSDGNFFENSPSNGREGGGRHD